MAKKDLLSIIQSVENIPALPHVVIRVMQLTEDPNSSIQDINAALQQDQGMTARVLRMANSAFYGFPRRIATVTDATILLGFKTLRSILIAAAVNDLMNKDMEGYALENGNLWKHSQFVAYASRLIAKQAGFTSLDLAYTAGLLHDIGKIILDSYLKESYQEVINKVNSQPVTFLEVENEVIGFNHAQIGARIARKWNLPDELAESIALHHNPEKARVNPRLTAIVHLADTIVLYMGVGIGISGLKYSFSASSLQLLGLEERDLEGLISQLADLLVDLQSF